VASHDKRHDERASSEDPGALDSLRGKTLASFDVVRRVQRGAHGLFGRNCFDLQGIDRALCEIPPGGIEIVPDSIRKRR
jgi:hypothetical protein